MMVKKKKSKKKREERSRISKIVRKENGRNGGEMKRERDGRRREKDFSI